MRSLQKEVFSAGASLAALLLILFGEVLADPADGPNPSFAAFQTDSKELRATSISSVVSIQQNSSGKGEIEEQLRLFLEELKRLEKEAEEKFRKEILPYLKREIEKLRKRLKEFSPDKEEGPQPQRIGV
jgi:hypothetical protein